MSDKPLRMVTCGWCETKVFIPGDLAPLATVPCTKCGHPIMMPMMLRQFELRSIVGSGGMGTVYRAWDTTLERMVAVKLMKKELLRGPEGAGRLLPRSPRLRPAEPHQHRPHLHLR